MRIDRLQMIVDHLRNGQLAHEIFDFEHYNSDKEGMPVSNRCGTNGCAIGEFPVIFPEDWSFDSSKELNTSSYNLLRTAGNYLKIGEYYAAYLFVSGPKRHGASGLKPNATKEQVADHIQKFIDEHSQDSTS